MGALVKIDRARVARYAREQNLAPEDALSRLLDEAVAATERAGRNAVEQTGQELINTHAEVDGYWPATLSAAAGFSGDRERASVAFDRWNEALAERATILRTFLRGEEIFRESIDEGFQKELEERWSHKSEEEIRQLIESNTAAAAKRDLPSRPWWLDWEQAARHPSKTRLLLSTSFALFGLFCAVFLVTLWSVLPAVVLGALGGLAIAEYGMHHWRRSAPSAPLDDPDD